MTSLPRYPKKSIDLEQSRAERRDVQTKLRQDAVENVLFARRGLATYTVEEAYDYKFVFTDEHVQRNMVERTKMHILKIHVDGYYAAMLDAVDDITRTDSIQQMYSAIKEITVLCTTHSDAMGMLLSTGMISHIVALLYCSFISRDLLKSVLTLLTEYTCRDYNGNAAKLVNQSFVNVLIQRITLLDIDITELVLDILVNIMTDSRLARTLAIDAGVLTHIGAFLTSHNIDPVIMHGSIKALTILVQADVPPALHIVNSSARLFQVALFSTDPVLSYYGFTGLRNILKIAHLDYSACAVAVLTQEVYARMYAFLDRRVSYDVLANNDIVSALAWKTLDFIETLTGVRDDACAYLVETQIVPRLIGMLHIEHTTSLTLSYAVLSNLILAANKQKTHIFNTDFYDAAKTPKYEFHTIKRARATMICSLVAGYSPRELQYLALNGAPLHLTDAIGHDSELTRDALAALDKILLAVDTFSPEAVQHQVRALLHICKLQELLEDTEQNTEGACSALAGAMCKRIYGQDDGIVIDASSIMSIHGNERLFADLARYMTDNNN